MWNVRSFLKEYGSRSDDTQEEALASLYKLPLSVTELITGYQGAKEHDSIFALRLQTQMLERLQTQRAPWQTWLDLWRTTTEDQRICMLVGKRFLSALPQMSSKNDIVQGEKIQAIFRPLDFTMEELARLFLLLRRSGTTGVHYLLVKEIRRRAYAAEEVPWRSWANVINEVSLSNWLGKYAQRQLMKSVSDHEAFQPWYERWSYLTSAIRLRFPTQERTYQSPPASILEHLLKHLERTAHSAEDWTRYLDLLERYSRESEPQYNLRLKQRRAIAESQLTSLIKQTTSSPPLKP